MMKEKVLSAMKEADKPVSVGDLVKLSGLDRDEVAKAFEELRKDGSIISPVRCKWESAK